MSSNLMSSPQPLEQLPRWHMPAVALIALAASLTSIGNGFAYDDILIIAANERIHSLASW